MKTIVIYSLKDENYKGFNVRVFESEEKAKKYIKEFEEMWNYYSTFNHVNWILL